MLISNRLNESEQKLNSAIKIATQMFPAKLYKVNQFKIELEQFKQDVIQVNKI